MSDTEILIEFDADTSKLQKSVKEAISKTESELESLVEKVKKDTKNLRDYGLDNKSLGIALRQTYQEIDRLSERVSNLRLMASLTTKEFQRMSQTSITEKQAKDLLTLQKILDDVASKVRKVYQSFYLLDPSVISKMMQMTILHMSKSFQEMFQQIRQSYYSLDLKKPIIDFQIMQQSASKVLKTFQEIPQKVQQVSVSAANNVTKSFQEMSQKALQTPIKDLLSLKNVALNVANSIKSGFSDISNSFDSTLGVTIRRTRDEIISLGQSMWQNLTNGAKNAAISTNNLNNHLFYTSQRLINIARSAFFFNIISRTLRGLSREMLSLVERDYYLSNSLLVLKANLINAFAPIMRIILPWIRALADGIAWLAQRFVEFINWLTGSNAKVVFSPFEAKNVVQSYEDLVHPPKLNDIGSGLSKINKPISNLNKNLAKTSKKAPKVAKSMNKLLASFDRIEVLDFKKEPLSMIKGLTDGLLKPLDSIEEKIPKIASKMKQLKVPGLGKGGGILGGKNELPKIKFEVDPRSVEALNNVKNIFKSIGDWFNEHPLAKGILEWLLATAAVNSVLGKILKIAPKVGKALLLAFSNPTLLAISASIAAFAVIVKNWEKIQKGLDKSLFGTKFTGNDVWEGIAGWNPRHRGKLPDVVQNKMLADGIPPEVIESINKAESAEARWNEKLEKTNDLMGKIKSAADTSTSDDLKQMGKMLPLLDTDTERLKKSIAGLYNTIVGIIPTSKLVSSEVGKSFDKIGNKAEKAGNTVKKELPNGFVNAFEQIKKNFENVKKWSSDKLLNIKKWFSDRWNDFIKYGKELIDSAIKGIKIGWSNLKGWANIVWTRITNWVSNLWNNISNGVSNGLKKCWDSIYNWFANIGKEIGKWWNKIWEKLPDAFKSVLDFAKGGFSLNIFGGGGNIPQLASGAVLRGGDPFLAYLNDQPRGQTNIEAPLSTIIDAIREAFPNQTTSPVINISADGDLNGIIRLLNLKLVDEQRRTGTSMVEVVY